MDEIRWKGLDSIEVGEESSRISSKVVLSIASYLLEISFRERRVGNSNG